jgi:hypothetical protein
MYHLRGLVFTTVVFAFGIFGLANISIMSVFAEPKVDISPTCGPHEPGFNIVINANGFMPNSNVAYKFVTSDNKIPLYGYFETNSTGGFNDITFADDLKPDHYKLYFADDADNDNAFDIGSKRIYANVTIPCPPQ